MADEYLEMLRRHPPFEEGKTIYDVPYVARKWKEAGFSVEEAEEWVKAGAYMEHYAVGMKELGLTLEDVVHQVEFTASFAFWYTRGIITARNYKQHLKKPSPPRVEIQPAVFIVEKP